LAIPLFLPDIPPLFSFIPASLYYFRPFSPFPRLFAEALRRAGMEAGIQVPFFSEGFPPPTAEMTNKNGLDYRHNLRVRRSPQGSSFALSVGSSFPSLLPLFSG
jgi:hypothetical protein